MRVFEFHFNPKLKTDLIFDSFCYEPENIYERRIGSLYLVGLLKNVLPQNLHFLDRLAKVIKDQYYRSTLVSAEKSLKESLRQANEFLEGIAKKGDVSWLGNFSYAVLSLKNFELNFTKVGEIKIFLLRRGQIIDIDKKLRFQDIEPYPLKIFGNIVSGKLAENDLILALTKEVSETFQNQNLINEVAKITPFDGKKLSEFFKTKNELLSKISGVCLAIFLSKEVLAGKKEIILPRPKEFSLREIFSSVVNYFKKLIKKPRWAVGGWRPLLKFPRFKLPKITIPKLPRLNKNLISILALIFFLAIGFFVAEQEKKQQLKIYQNNLNQIQEKVNQAESLLILKKVNPQLMEQANSLFKESWEEISSLAKEASAFPLDFQNQIFSLKNKVTNNLFELNKLEIIERPELFFEFDSQQFIPQKMVIFDNELYFFSPYTQNLFKINQNRESEIIQIDKKFNLAIALSDSILFFSKPNQLVNFKNGEFSQASSLGEPYPKDEEDKSSSLPFATARVFNFDDFSSYKSNLYFLDKKPGEIIKYPYLEALKWSSPQLWLNSQTKKVTLAKSMAVDGSVWILTKTNEIQRYYAGRLQETLKLDIFPEPKEFSKIFASPYLPHLYILEPIQKRIMILTKAGETIKQFQSEKFDNLLDFGVSENGKTIYLLNGLKVFKMEF